MIKKFKSSKNEDNTNISIFYDKFSTQSQIEREKLIANDFKETVYCNR